MGANAQTTVPTFTSGQVLTADQQNQSARTGVPVFATTVTRDAAFGGSGEKTLAEGQLCYLESDNVVQYYDGAAWATVGPASAGGLVVVKAETTFSASSSVTADSVFTSTYTDYILVAQYTSSGDNQLLVRFRTSGSSNTNSNYQEVGFRGGSSAASGVNANGTSLFVNYAGQTNAAGVRLLIQSPQASAQTIVNAEGFSNSGGSTSYGSVRVSGSFNATTSFDGIELFPTSNNITGRYAIYGLAKS